MRAVRQPRCAETEVREGPAGTHRELDDDVDADERVEAGRGVDVEGEEDERRGGEEAARLEDGERNAEVRVVPPRADSAAARPPDLAGDQGGDADVDDEVQCPGGETPPAHEGVLEGSPVEVLGDSEERDAGVEALHDQLRRRVSAKIRRWRARDVQEGRQLANRCPRQRTAAR